MAAVVAPLAKAGGVMAVTLAWERVPMATEG